MRAIFAIVLVAGLALAAFSANMIKNYMASQQQALVATQEVAAQRAEVVPVIAATRAIAYGEQIKPADVEVIGYAKPYLPEGTFDSLEAFFPEGNDVLRRAVRPVEPREPFLAVKVTEPGSEAGLQTRLPPGMRAFAISTDVSSGVSGFLRPGDRVDVYWTGPLPNGNEVTRLIQPGIEILAVDQTADVTREGAMIARTVTVKADPQQVAALAQAQSTGKLSLALVGITDTTTTEVVEVDQRSLLDLAEDTPMQPVMAPPEQRVCTVRNRRGAEVVVIEIPCPE